MVPIEDREPVSDNLSLMKNALPNRLEALESASDVLAAVLESLKESYHECVIEKVLNSSHKSVVLLGDCRGIPCVVKCMVGNDRYWAQRFGHEQRIY